MSTPNAESVLTPRVRFWMALGGSIMRVSTALSHLAMIVEDRAHRLVERHIDGSGGVS